MPKKSLGLVLLVAGVLLALVFLGADHLGLGASPGVGLKQIGGAAVGMILAVAGIMILYRPGQK